MPSKYATSYKISPKKVSVYMHRSYSLKRNSGDGQGLVEYSIILALLALAVIAVLVVFGPRIGNLYSQAASAFGSDGDELVVEPAVEPVDGITIVQVDYYWGTHAHIDAQFNGGADPSVSLTASPGGLMQIVDLHYHIIFPLPGAPREVTITSSTGSSMTVMVGP